VGSRGSWRGTSLRTVDYFPDAIVRRLLDIAVSGLVLLIALPILLVVAAVIKLDSTGPVFFRCRRVGFHGGELLMLKFRKMRHGAVGAAVTLSGDDRFTRVGRMLAKTKLDELPQLWHVLRGEMTLVGPRPEDPGFVELRGAEYATILTVKPGVTGLCQLAFAKEGEVLRPEDRIRDYVERLLPQKAALDVLYVGRRSLLMDFRILAWTAVAVLGRRDVAVHRSTGKLGLRRRPLEDVAALPVELGVER
jgi:lipopolysaccharide/colanic/teichoic acid biosynthesis glycosyltransferase